MSAADEVRQASAQFYAALNRMINGDASAMAGIWTQSAEATTMHPIGGREVGWQAVQPVWSQVAGIAGGGQATLDNQMIRAGSDMAVEIGDERGAMTLAGRSVAIDHRVTNVYRKEGGHWKIVHHHTDTSPAMQQLLAELQGKA